MNSRLANAVDQCFAATGVPYGFEPSSKLLPGQLLQERFLISIPRDAFGRLSLLERLPVEYLQEMPEAVRSWLNSGWSDADMVHFGVEQSTSPVLKIYLENCSGFEQALRTRSSQWITLFDAMKWGEGMPGVASRYQCLPEASETQLMQQVDDSFADSDEDAREIARSFLQRAMTILPAEQLMMLSVDEPDTERSSFDLNLYDLELSCSDWQEQIEAIWDYQDIKESLQDFMAENGARQLGHISAGTGRNGAVFFTLYYGVSERNSAATSI